MPSRLDRRDLGHQSRRFISALNLGDSSQRFISAIYHRSAERYLLEMADVPRLHARLKAWAVKQATSQHNNNYSSAVVVAWAVKQATSRAGV